jgi:hypothetical protein
MGCAGIWVLGLGEPHLSDASFRVQKSGRHGVRQVCQICGDGLGTTTEGDVFAACDVCGFPVCRPCYEYERKDGTQACPQCKTKYRRHKGNPTFRVNYKIFELFQYGLHTD